MLFAAVLAVSQVLEGKLISSCLWRGAVSCYLWITFQMLKGDRHVYPEYRDFSLGKQQTQIHWFSYWIKFLKCFSFLLLIGCHGLSNMTALSWSVVKLDAKLKVLSVLNRMKWLPLVSWHYWYVILEDFSSLHWHHVVDSDSVCHS